MRSTSFRHQTIALAALLSIASVTLVACGGDDDNSPRPAPPASTPSSPANPSSPGASQSPFTAGNLLVSRSVYDPANVVTGQLPYNATPGSANANPVMAVTPGTFPNVFTNEANDANFGVTSAIWLDQWAPQTTAPASSTNLTNVAKAQSEDLSTSFPSKSELGLSVSLDKSAITFMGYNAAPNQLDISNSNTPGLTDPSNTDVAPATYRSVAQLNLADGSLQVTHTNAYGGNNGRAAVLANGVYYLVGNAGNSGKTPKPTNTLLGQLSMTTGLQSIVPQSGCAFTTVIGKFMGASAYTPPAAGSCGLGTIASPSATGDQFGFSIASINNNAADKTGKDVNLRGMFVSPDGTLYVTKGSGGNGINTVYQVGATGALANGGKLDPTTTTITVAPGFTTTLAANLTPFTASSTITGAVYPFGLWMPDANTMFVADEGDGNVGTQAIGSGGLWEYKKQADGTWKAMARFTTGLNLGTPYTVADTNGTYGTRGASYTTTPAGLRQVTGTVNGDGSYTVYATTSTIGNSLGTSYDAGADSNQLVSITIGPDNTSAKGFQLLQTAPYGQVLRGVAIVPKRS